MSVIGLLWLFLAPAALSTPSGAPPTAEPAIAASGAFFALSVPDAHASALWYSEKLGLKVVMEQPKQAGAAVTVLEGRGLIVELIQHDGSISLEDVQPKVENRMLVHGLVKAGALLDDFDQAVAALKNRGVDIAFGPYPASKNQRPNVIVRDNAGNLIQFFGK